MGTLKVIKKGNSSVSGWKTIVICSISISTHLCRSFTMHKYVKYYVHIKKVL